MNKIKKELLCQWLEASKENLLPYKEYISYGCGYNSWGVQTNQKALAAYAVAGKLYNNKEYIDIALKLLRFSLASHIEGPINCTDNTMWGHTWISGLGVTRMMHGVNAISEYMTKEDHENLKKVLLSEAEYLSGNYVIKAGLDGLSGHNMPENNIWNGAMVLKAALLYPEEKHAKKYLKKAEEFFVNGICTEEDIEKNGAVGANFFDTLALNHHGYFNIGYMVICLSNIAMLHFYLKEKQIETPEFVFHRAKELWDVVKKFMFEDGRLIRIGGDTRIRYTYCQEYLIPVLYLAEDVFGEKGLKSFHDQWILQIKKEFDYNNDGTFLSERCQSLNELSPVYYHRLESDRATTLSMSLWYSEQFKALSTIDNKLNFYGEFYDAYHGAYYIKDQKRIASWTWIAAQRPTGLLLPTEESAMADWTCNLTGEIRGLGKYFHNVINFHKGEIIEGGFHTLGQVAYYSDIQMEGSPNSEKTAEGIIAYFALPDGNSSVCIQNIKSVGRQYIKGVKGLSFKIPNDLFNDKRVYEYRHQKATINGDEHKDLLIDTRTTKLAIDGKIFVTVANGHTLKIYRPKDRQVNIRKEPYVEGYLHVDEIITNYNNKRTIYEDNDMLINTCALLSLSDETKIEDYVYEQDTYAITIVSDNDKKYILLCNCSNVNSEIYVKNEQFFVKKYSTMIIEK